MFDGCRDSLHVGSSSYLCDNWLPPRLKNPTHAISAAGVQRPAKLDRKRVHRSWETGLCPQHRAASSVMSQSTEHRSFRLANPAGLLWLPSLRSSETSTTQLSPFHLNHQFTDAVSPLPTPLMLCHHPRGMNKASPSLSVASWPARLSLFESSQTARSRSAFSRPAIISSPLKTADDDVVLLPCCASSSCTASNSAAPTSGAYSRTLFVPASCRNRFGFGSRCSGV